MPLGREFSIAMSKVHSRSPKNSESVIRGLGWFLVSCPGEFGLKQNTSDGALSHLQGQQLLPSPENRGVCP